MTRRNFLSLSSACPLALVSTEAARAQQVAPRSIPNHAESQTSRGQQPLSVREFLDRLTYRREEVDTFLNPAAPNWAKFDPELGYTLRNSIVKDGVDGSLTIATYAKAGERKAINYADRPCRINAYGDSFTQCHQVSDGETWEEYLAAHLGEPLRNFGVGGYGVYQAYRRMLREEATTAATEYLILNIWGIDDHLRSIDAWRWLRFGDSWRTVPSHILMFHGNPWAHIRLDLNTGKAVEIENPYSTPESLYKLCDKDYVFEHFKDDPIVQLIVAEQGGADVNAKNIKALAEAFKVDADFSTPEGFARTAHAVHVEYGLRASVQILEKARAFAQEKNKKLLILLSYDSAHIIEACKGFRRIDQEFVGFLKENNVQFVDVMAKHVEDFRNFNLSPAEYVRRYYIGHYKPQGNHFFAFAVKDAIVDWLEPKPPAYRAGEKTCDQLWCI